MKKSIKIIGITLAITLIFGLGTLTGAKTDWKTDVINEANSRIGKAGYNKKQEIVTSDIGEQMKLALDPTIKEYEDELAKLLDEYFQLKLQGVLNSDEITALEEQMAQIKLNIFNRYKQDIDSMFE